MNGSPKVALAWLEYGATAGFLVFAAIAALYWLKSANVPVRDDLDNFIADLQQAGGYNSTAAINACLAAVCQIISTASQFASRWF